MAKANPKATTATEQQKLCLELIQKFAKIEDVEPAIKTAVATVKQQRDKRAAAAKPAAGTKPTTPPKEEPEDDSAGS